MSKQLTFYFIRHGRTQWNEQELLQGSGNSPLTEQGITGAQKTGGGATTSRIYRCLFQHFTTCH